MRSATIAIHWHDDGHPVYSLDFQPINNQSRRLATAGGDTNVRIWKIRYSAGGDPHDASVEYLSTLRKHTQAVNAVRFDSTGNFLASGGDDGMLILWTLSNDIVQDFGVQDDDVKESWVVRHVFNTNSEIYDLSFSPDSKYIATGSMDNTAKIYCTSTGQKVFEMCNHSHYVQGISWDPLNEYLATQSADRSVGLYAIESSSLVPTFRAKLYSKLARADIPSIKLSSLYEMDKTTQRQAGAEEECFSKKDCHSALAPFTKKVVNLYHSENLQSFFRRLSFSPDGSLLVVPSGVFKIDNQKESIAEGATESTPLNTVYIYTRSGFNQPPVCHIPGLSKPAIAVAFNPVKFKISSDSVNRVFALPYKMVFAVATHDAVIIYDTERLEPLGMSSNLHYLSITDICWDRDGHNIMVSSAEGFCSLITFDEVSFGPPFDSKA